MELKNENEKIYEELYLSDRNNVVLVDNCVDYSGILRSYSNYLTLFMTEESSFYMDLQFLSYAINGFSYCHDLIFGAEDILKSDEVSKYSLDTFDKIKSCGEYGKNTYSDEEIVFILSLACSVKLKEENLIDFLHEDVEQMINNNYKINKVMKKCIKNGM